MGRWLIPGIVAMLVGNPLAGAANLPGPPEIWRDYDPNRGDFREVIVKTETRNGVLHRESYISADVLGQEIRVYCVYRVKDGLTHAPGLLDVHGWMGTATVHQDFVEGGWAVMGFDYCGKTGDRKHYTRYPESLRHGNMDDKEGPVIHDSTPDHRSITDAKQTSEYLWYAIERRVLSYLEQQKEVDRTRLGATGYSYGGTILWALGTDPRVKAIVPHFGIGWIEYYRNKRVWMYNVPPVEPARTPGEEVFLAGVAPEAYVPDITAATLYLSGSNDHHGGFERGLESFKRFRNGVPWAFAVQARGHHDTDKIEQNGKLWLEKYVAGRGDIVWPENPKSDLRLDPEGIPELVVSPALPERVDAVEIYYARKSPVSFERAWIDAPCVKTGKGWAARVPVLDVDDYVFAYANIRYDSTIVLSTAFHAIIPSKLGKARATDRKSDVFSSGGEETNSWSDVVAIEGPRGIRGFRSTNNRDGSGTEKLNDPKWQAPANSQLRIKFSCAEPQVLILSANDYNDLEIAFTASDLWQEMVIPVDRLIHRFARRPILKDWSEVGKIHFQPGPGSDITKVLFAEFGWVEGVKNVDKE